MLIEIRQDKRKMMQITHYLEHMQILTTFGFAYITGAKLLKNPFGQIQ